ncbi:hypothetical protein LJB89_04325, partial [Tyzzerella sp. OttesenSCG-928-J15]|nr:hypothetical protein [Tyzzerella sp. OttesenSCG-928-J15]
MKEKILKPIFSFFSNRIFILLVVICALFYFLVAELFQLQIVEGEAHQATLSATIAKEVDLSAQRGNIYDRYGRPLAVNQFAYSVLIDPSITMANDGELNNVILNLVNLLEANGEEYIDDLPISADEPYEFTFHNDEEKTKQVKWIINQMSLSKDETEAAEMSPYYVLELLRDRFEIDESMTNAQARKVISIRTKMWLIRYYSYNPVEIATNVSMDTVTRIEEDADKYKSIIVDKVASRYYPEGEYLAHIVGYVGRINSDEYDTYVSQKGYDASDIVGKTGIELAFEDNLRGTAGSQTVIVNTSGRKVSDIEGSRVDPKQGDKVFLTIDAALQRELYDKTVETLKEVIIGRLTSIDPKVWPLTAKEVYSSMVAANNLSPKEIFESQPGSYSHEVKQYVLSVNPEANVDSNEERLAINQLIAEGIEDDSINLKTIILVMWEQGIITGDAYYV